MALLFSVMLEVALVTLDLDFEDAVLSLDLLI